MVHFAKINQVHPLLKVVAYWKSSNTETCPTKLSKILASNIDNSGRESVSEFMWGIARSKESVVVKYIDGICAELYLKLWFDSDWYFCNITESGWFWKRLFRNKLHFYEKETPRQVFSSEYHEISRNSFFLQNTSGGCFYQLDKVTCSVLGICRTFLLNHKHNAGWFLLKRFLDLVRVCSLHIIS